jgi:hypothetical protein
MEAVTLCCNSSYSEGSGLSPFDRTVAFEYHDGPTTGVIECRDCKQAFIFTLLAIDDEGKYDRHSWNEGKEIRVFSLRELQSSSFEEIVSAFSRYSTPTWPVWAPLYRGPHTERALKALEGKIAHILSRTSEPKVVLATHDLLVDFVAISYVSLDDLIETSDWFLFLGLAPDPSRST